MKSVLKTHFSLDPSVFSIKMQVAQRITVKTVSTDNVKAILAVGILSPSSIFNP